MSDFKWRKGEHEELYNKIKRFNNKIKRARKNGNDIKLPNFINYKEELNNILSGKTTREAFNNKVKLLDIFLDKNALEIEKSKKGAMIPKWELRQLKEVIIPNINKTNRELKKQSEEITGIKEQKKLNPNEIRKRDVKWENKSKTEWEMFTKTFNQFNKSVEEIQKKTKESYYKALDNELDSIDALAIQGILDNLPANVVSANAYFNKNTEFRYTYSRDDYKIKFKKIKNAWTKVYNDYYKQEEEKQKKNKKSKR